MCICWRSFESPIVGWQIGWYVVATFDQPPLREVEARNESIAYLASLRMYSIFEKEWSALRTAVGYPGVVFNLVTWRFPLGARSFVRAQRRFGFGFHVVVLVCVGRFRRPRVASVEQKGVAWCRVYLLKACIALGGHRLGCKVFWLATTVRFYCAYVRLSGGSASIDDLGSYLCLAQ